MPTAKDPSDTNVAMLSVVVPPLKLRSSLLDRAMRSGFLLLMLTAGALANSFAEDGPDFNREIRPLLSDRCFSCHGPDEVQRQAELRLDRPTDLQAMRGQRPLVNPGSPNESLLFERITSEDSELRMPPADSGLELKDEDIQLLQQWIANGAQIADHWAFVKPRRFETPGTTTTEWPQSWIDHFILKTLKDRGLEPSRDADPVTLIRRLSFDLTGLPPDPQIVEQFSASPTQLEFAKLVDQMLESDACAERLTMYWLDLVRYADTVGYHGDQDHPISPYRDWVIDAFASNMPFDRFTHEQLAGDLLKDSGVDEKVASGYNRLLQTSHEGGVQPKEYLAIYAADRVRNLSAVWMGATVGCAQCHDHKYDPYSTRDFYSLAAFFADLDEDQHFYDGSNALPTKRAPELQVLSRRERNDLNRLKQQLATADSESEAVRLEEEIKSIEASRRRTMISVAKQPRPMRILPRGNWLDDSGDLVQPAVPEFLGSVAPKEGDRATRLDLARWLTDAEHGNGLFTARVFANRFWYLLFGQGLCRSLDDFGGQGHPPDHPELLDRLAFEFVDSGWDIRHLVRTIVHSRTWQQSSDWTPELRSIDPDNRLFARQSSHRLSAEAIRDNALKISGLLVERVGGPSVRPYQPVGYYRHLNFPKRTYSHHEDDRQWRRGLYVHWQRQFLHPMLKAFDAPSREECTPARPQSNTPLAALTLLNDPTFVEAARAFALRILSEATASDTDRLQFAIRQALSRPADDEELRLLTVLLDDARDIFRDQPTAADDLLSAVPTEMSPVDAAAWTTIARAILNLDEMLMRR